MTRKKEEEEMIIQNIVLLGSCGIHGMGKWIKFIFLRLLDQFDLIESILVT